MRQEGYQSQVNFDPVETVIHDGDDDLDDGYTFGFEIGSQVDFWVLARGCVRNLKDDDTADVIDKHKEIHKVPYKYLQTPEHDGNVVPLAESNRWSVQTTTVSPAFVQIALPSLRMTRAFVMISYIKGAMAILICLQWLSILNMARISRTTHCKVVGYRRNLQRIDF